MNPRLERWHRLLEAPDAKTLGAMLHPDVVFHSPVVHTPQRGRGIVIAYLMAAFQVLGGEKFRYLRTFDCGDRAVLEFVTELDGLQVNGIDMIEWDETGLITDFKVKIRPLKAVNAVHARMGELLAAMKG